MSVTVAKRKPTMSAKQLRDLRDRAGLTQVEAAKQLESTIGTYRGWEQGRRHVPRPVAKLARILFDK